MCVCIMGVCAMIRETCGMRCSTINTTNAAVMFEVSDVVVRTYTGVPAAYPVLLFS